MADKVTTMELKVDLQCPRCYRKIKKVLCKFPEIRDQMYDVKKNKVTITVVTCCPDVILKRINSKGGRSVESIEIIAGKKKEPEKKTEGGEKDKPKEVTAEKKKEAGREKDKSKEATVERKKKEAGREKDKSKEATVERKKKDAGTEKPKVVATADKKKDSLHAKPKQVAEKKPEAQVHKDVFEPVFGFPTIYPSGVFYPNQPFYQGYGSGVPMPMPCWHGHGRPWMCYGVPAYEGYVGNGGGYNNTGRLDYLSEENTEAFWIM